MKIGKTLFLFFFFAAIVFPPFSHSQVLEKDSLALVAFYDSLGGPNWKNTWDLSDSVSNWYGITLSGNRVSEIDLRRNDLQGHLPPQIGDLDSVKTIFLLGNQINGTIPEEIGNLTHLEALYLNNNNLQGPLPATLGNCSNLKVLRLENNQISGEIPSELGNLIHLEDLGLSNNNLSGTIPATFGNLVNLRSLHLSFNNLTGTIPAELGNLTNLIHFYLSYNQFTGTIPEELGNLTNLRFFEVYSNRLSGSLPESLGNLSALQYFRIQNNEFSGAVPPTFTQLDQLIEFKVSYNKLEDLPDLSVIPTLQQLYLDHNRFTFDDLEPLLKCENLTQFIYGDQDSVGEKQTLNINEGDSVALSVPVDGQWTRYQWFKDNVPLPEATDSLLIFPAVQLADSGTYFCQMTNDSLPYLILYSRPITLKVQSEVSDLPSSQEPIAIPATTHLFPNYPNPFNPTTTILYQLKTGSRVELAVFNPEGQLVKILVKGFQKPGKYQVTFTAPDLPSGMYFYRLVAGNFQQTRKMILLK